MRVWTSVVYTAGIAVALLMSYGFALIGEPTSYWFWHNIAGIIP